MLKGEKKIVHPPDYLIFAPGFQKRSWERCLRWSGCMSQWPSTPGLVAVADTLSDGASAAHLHFVLPDEHYTYVPLHNFKIIRKWIHTYVCICLWFISIYLSIYMQFIPTVHDKLGWQCVYVQGICVLVTMELMGKN